MQTLYGSIVQLEPLAPNHLESLAEQFKPEFTQHYPSFFDSAQHYYDSLIRDQAFGPVELFAICPLNKGTAVGCSGFLNIDKKHRRCEIGATWIGTQYQGSAVNVESKLLLLTYAFEERNCIRVEFKMDSLNARSAAAVTRLGATREGLLRNHMILPNGRFRHTAYFSIISDEWAKIRNDIQKRVQQKSKQEPN